MTKIKKKKKILHNNLSHLALISVLVSFLNEIQSMQQSLIFRLLSEQSMQTNTSLYQVAFHYFNEAHHWRASYCMAYM